MNINYFLERSAEEHLHERSARTAGPSTTSTPARSAAGRDRRGRRDDKGKSSVVPYLPHIVSKQCLCLTSRAISVTSVMHTKGNCRGDFSKYQNPMYLRVTKNGSAYVALYSVDGENWTQAASFTDGRACTSVGPFASNYNSAPANAAPVVMSVNWFDVLQ
jgi:hypothetical protein